MIKKILFILFTCYIFQFSRAQEIDFGPKIGANFATLGDIERLDSNIGFVGGAFLNIKFENFGIQPELLYSQQGDEFNLSDFDLDYINLPVIFKFYVVGGLNFQVGPQFGVLINDNIPDSIMQSFENETFDLTGVAGLGIDLALNLRISGRYIFDVENDLESAHFDEGFFTLALGITLL